MLACVREACYVEQVYLRRLAVPKVERIFNNRERKIFRKRIPKSETVFGIGFLVFTGVMGGWFIAQADAYDPADRDISTEAMEDGQVEDKLYRTPLARWVDPSQVTHAGGAAPMDTGAFPSAILEGGWSVGSRAQAFTPDNVYEKINGAADQYIQFGLKNAYFVGLEEPSAGLSLNIELYDQGAFENALGIFAAQRDPSQEVVADGGAYYYPTSIGAVGIAGPYYFKVAGAQEGEPTIAKARQLASVFAKMGSERGAAPKALNVFVDMLSVPFSKISFEKSDVFQFSFAKDFWFAQPEDGGPRYFVHEAGAEEEAAALFDQLVENNLYDYDAVEQGEGRALLKHKFLDEFLLLEQRGTTVYGMDGLADQEAGEQQLQLLEGAFFDEAM